MTEEKKTSGSLALHTVPRVITIQPTEQPEAQKLRVAAYARVSSDSRDQLNSFAAQNAYYTSLIAANPDWELVDVYADRGITGTSADKREDFQRLIADCKRGRIDKILVKSVSRFARNTKDCLETTRELKSIGVGVCFEEQNIDSSMATGEMLTAIFASLAQKESESISQNMRWSYQKRMKNGTFFPSSVPYGYTAREKRLEINGAQAGVVRQIFQAYLAGQSMDEITASLNRQGVPARNDDSPIWRTSSIAYILSNERYIGDSLWQKTYATETLPAEQVKNRGERKKYYAAGTHPAIIDRDTFEAVQRLRAERGKSLTAARRHIPYPLRRKLYCGQCGTGFRRKVTAGAVYWVCNRHDHAPEVCDVPRIREDTIYESFLRLYDKLWHQGRSILNQLLSNLQTARERRLLWSLDIVELNREIAETIRQDQLLAELKRQGLVDPDLLISRGSRLAEQRRKAKLKKEQLMEADGDTSIARTRELLEILDDGPEFLDTFDGTLFDELVEKIIVESGERLRFRLINGLELMEDIERMVR